MKIEKYFQNDIIIAIFQRRLQWTENTTYKLITTPKKPFKNKLSTDTAHIGHPLDLSHNYKKKLTTVPRDTINKIVATQARTLKHSERFRNATNKP